MRILVAALGSVAAAGVMLSGCSSKLLVTKDALQKDISDRLSEVGQRPQSVTCKDDLLGEAGKTTRCDVVLSPTNSFEPVVTVTGVRGTTVDYELKPALSKEQLQQSVTGLVEQGASVPVKSVNCESGLEGKQGVEAFCWVDAGGVNLRRTIEVQNVDGLMMNYQLVPVLIKAEIESALLDQMASQTGQRPESAACTDNLEGKVGTSIDCLVTAEAQTKTYAVTVATVDGNKINYNYEPKA